MSETYTIGEIAAAHGQSTRTVQFWTDMGVLHPVKQSNRKGKGTHRRFDEAEMRFAGLAKRLAAMNSPVGEIIEVINSIRSIDTAKVADAAADEIDDLIAEFKKIREKHAAATRFEIFNRCLTMLSRVALCSASSEIILVVSYFYEGSEVRTRILFIPSKFEPVIQAIAGKALHNFVGFKALTLSPDKEIWVTGKPDKELIEIFSGLYAAIEKFTVQVMAVFTESDRQKAALLSAKDNSIDEE